MVTALRPVGPDSLMTFLRRESPTDDPDVLAGAAYSGSMAGFILDYGPSSCGPATLTRCSPVRRRIERSRTTQGLLPRQRDCVGWRTSSAPQTPSRSKSSAFRSPSPWPRDQSVLAFALWQMRGAPGRSFLADWFYTALPSRECRTLSIFLARCRERSSARHVTAAHGHCRRRALQQVGWSPSREFLTWSTGHSRPPSWIRHYLPLHAGLWPA